MNFAVVWLRASKENQVLMANHESVKEVTSVESAKEEGRATLEELPSGESEHFRPLALVEMNFHMLSELEKCQTVSFEAEDDEGWDLTFHDVSELPYWKNLAWWPL